MPFNYAPVLDAKPGVSGEVGPHTKHPERAVDVVTTRQEEEFCRLGASSTRSFNLSERSSKMEILIIRWLISATSRLSCLMFVCICANGGEKIEETWNLL